MITVIQQHVKLVSCPINNLPCVIPSKAKESRFEIATSLTHLAMTMYRNVRDMTLGNRFYVLSFRC